MWSRSFAGGLGNQLCTLQEVCVLLFLESFTEILLVRSHYCGILIQRFKYSVECSVRLSRAYWTKSV